MRFSHPLLPWQCAVKLRRNFNFFSWAICLEKHRRSWPQAPGRPRKHLRLRHAVSFSTFPHKHLLCVIFAVWKMGKWATGREIHKKKNKKPFAANNLCCQIVYCGAIAAEPRPHMVKGNTSMCPTSCLPPPPMPPRLLWLGTFTFLNWK